VEDTMGAILLARHEPAAAVGHFGRATRIAPDNAAYHYRHACALRDSGKSTEAQTAFRKAVDLAPQPRPSWFAEAERGAGGN
jgi:Flp pilus assembly protein TadD